MYTPSLTDIISIFRILRDRSFGRINDEDCGGENVYSAVKTLKCAMSITVKL